MVVGYGRYKEFVAKIASIDYDMAQIVKLKRNLQIPIQAWGKDKVWNKLVYEKFVLEKKKKAVLDNIVTAKLPEYKEYNKKREAPKQPIRKSLNLPDPIEMVIYPPELKWECEVNEHDMLKAVYDVEKIESMLKKE